MVIKTNIYVEIDGVDQRALGKVLDRLENQFVAILRKENIMILKNREVSTDRLKNIKINAKVLSREEAMKILKAKL